MPDEQNVIQYYIKERYGRKDRIPVDEKFLRILGLIAGKRVLDDSIIRGFQELGFSFEVVVEPGIK